jgi:hypothetical protein
LLYYKRRAFLEQAKTSTQKETRMRLESQQEKLRHELEEERERLRFVPRRSPEMPAI